MYELFSKNKRMKGVARLLNECAMLPFCDRTVDVARNSWATNNEATLGIEENTVGMRKGNGGER
jgi:hypothetical protein